MGFVFIVIFRGFGSSSTYSRFLRSIFIHSVQHRDQESSSLTRSCKTNNVKQTVNNGITMDKVCQGPFWYKDWVFLI